MGKYLDMQIYVLSNSPVIQKKVSQAVETLSLEPTHAWEVFPAAGPTGVIKEPIQENAHVQPSKQWPFREMQWALFIASTSFRENSGRGDRNHAALDFTQ